MVIASIMLVICLAMGTVFFWDVRGYATRVRRGLEENDPLGALYKKLPSWAFRAVGVWCFAFGIGLFAVLVALEH